MKLNIRRLLIGRPLTLEQIEGEKLNVPLGLAVFSADALSSTAYATDEIIIALGAAPLLLSMSIPVALAIVGLIFLVVLSYRQIIAVYQDGGGAYVVAKENLGPVPSLVAAAALMIDYILTVAVSVSAGVAAITSTKIISADYATAWCVGSTLVILVMNLRGVKESGIVFAVPAYIFLAAMFYLIVKGICFSPQLAPAAPLHPSDWMGSGAIFLFLRAFAHGCAGLTGIEAVSNGVKAFKEPSGVRANKTMTIMGLLLAGIFCGITWLAYQLHVTTTDETVLSQVSRAVVGDKTPAYYWIQFSTMIMLILAANTAFADFPRVARRLAEDSYMPRQLRNLGDRLVLNNGILVLGALSIALLLIFQGDTHRLMPLYAVGVFLSFTLSQSGMVVYQIKHKPRNWHFGVLINAVGAVVTLGVTLLLAVEKFQEGAWVIVFTVPALVLMFSIIRAHYQSVGRQLALTVTEAPQPGSHHVLLLVSALGRGTLEALAYARSICPNVEAVHVEVDPEASERLRTSWMKWAGETQLTILRSPYRSLSDPILAYLDELDRIEHDRYVTIIIPEFVTKKLWHNLLHNQSALQLSALLRFRKGKIVTTYRYYLEE